MEEEPIILSKYINKMLRIEYTCTLQEETELLKYLVALIFYRSQVLIVVTKYTKVALILQALLQI